MEAILGTPSILCLDISSPEYAICIGHSRYAGFCGLMVFAPWKYVKGEKIREDIHLFGSPNRSV